MLRTFTKPESTTYLMPSMVTEASAMFVASMTFLVSLGGRSKMISCSSVGSVAYKGRASICGAALGKLEPVSDGVS